MGHDDLRGVNVPYRWTIPHGDEPEDASNLLKEAARLLEADLKSTFSSAVSVGLSTDDDGEAFLLVVGSDSVTPIWITVEGLQASTTVALAERVLDSALFDDVQTPWPACPDHPGDPHSMRPAARGAQACWICPVSGRAVAAIGALAS